VSRREEVAELYAAGLNGRQIAAALGITPPTVAYHLRRLGIAAQPRPKYDWDEIQAYYDAGHSVRECLTHFGCSGQTWHAARQRGDIVTRPQRMTIEQLTSRASHRGNVKRRLLEDGMLAPECGRCGIATWRGAALTLELHHVNGDGADHRLENLELLCPNCHSQTDSWGGRNRRVGRDAA
jgi:5-methylcytosine-specific restriction endonuclease McrA